MEMSHLKIESKNTQQRREQMEMSYLKTIRRLTFIVSHVLGGRHSLSPLHPHK